MDRPADEGLGPRCSYPGGRHIRRSWRLGRAPAHRASSLSCRARFRVASQWRSVRILARRCCLARHEPLRSRRSSHFLFHSGACAAAPSLRVRRCQRVAGARRVRASAARAGTPSHLTAHRLSLEAEGYLDASPEPRRRCRRATAPVGLGDGPCHEPRSRGGGLLRRRTEPSKQERSRGGRISAVARSSKRTCHRSRYSATRARLVDPLVATRLQPA